MPSTSSSIAAQKTVGHRSLIISGTGELFLQKDNLGLIKNGIFSSFCVPLVNCELLWVQLECPIVQSIPGLFRLRRVECVLLRAL